MLDFVIRTETLLVPKREFGKGNMECIKKNKELLTEKSFQLKIASIKNNKRNGFIA